MVCALSTAPVAQGESTSHSATSAVCRIDRQGPELDQTPDPPGIGVGDQHLRARLEEVSGEWTANRAQTLDDDSAAAKLSPEPVADAGCDAMEDADRGVGAGVAGAAGLRCAAEDMGTDLGDDVHVAGRRCSYPERSCRPRPGT